MTMPTNKSPEPTAVTAAVAQFSRLGHVRTFMKAIIVCILSCLPVFGADTNDVRIVTWSYKVLPEDSLATIEVFTRGDQTNLVRQTHTKDGVVLLRNQSFYHDGAEVGIYMYQVGHGPDITSVGSTPGAPYYFNIGFDASNRPRSAHIMATNLVMLDWFDCTNGIFYPTDSSLIREANGRLPKVLPTH
jgi:hypothetical protein